MDKLWWPDNPLWPYNTQQLLEILASGDRVEMARFFRKFKEIADIGLGTPLHWQQFIANMLVMAAENPGYEVMELGLSDKKATTKHRNEVIIRFIHRLRMMEEKLRGEKDLSGSLDVALTEAAGILHMKKGSLSRIYAKSDDSVKRAAERDAVGSIKIPIHIYVNLIFQLRKK